jgi:hypothetical protein
MQVIANTIQSFMWIFLLLFIFIYIYALLGMSIFGGDLDFPDSPTRMVYNDFFIAFIATFNFITMENWNDSMAAALSTSINKYLSLAYMISWIFLGNYVLANIFLAILLDGFDEDALQEDFEELEEDIEIAPDIDLNHGSNSMPIGNSSYFNSKLG